MQIFHFKNMKFANIFFKFQIILMWSTVTLSLKREIKIFIHVAKFEIDLCF